MISPRANQFSPPPITSKNLILVSNESTETVQQSLERGKFKIY